MDNAQPRLRWRHLRFLFLLILFSWLVYYQTGPALVQFQHAWANDHSSLDRFIDPIFDLVLPVFEIGFGFAVVMLKPSDEKAWLLLGLLLSFAEAGRSGPNVSAARPWLRWLVRAYQDSGEELWPAWLCFFLLYFPTRLRIDLRWPWLKWVLIAPFTLTSFLLIARFLRYPLAAKILTAEGSLAVVFAYSPLVFILALLSVRYSLAETADERRRLRLFYAGTLVTLLPAIVLTAVRNILHKPNFDFAPAWTVAVVFALIGLFPAVLAYVIVVQRAMDVRVVVRQGIQYTLAQRGVNVLRAAVIVAFIYVMVMLTQRHAGVWPQILAIAAGIVVINGIRWIAEKARHWIDKRFFREQLRAEELLGRLANDVHRIIRTDELLKTVAERVASSLHVDRIAVWLTDGVLGLTPAYAVNAEGWNAGPVLESLRDTKKPILCDDSPVGGGAEVVLPLMARDELLGAMVLGAKRSEEPYSPMDLDVLGTVASQTGLALDNSRLATSLAAEAAQRERLNREIEIAREVQQTLLPQDGPPVPGIEYAGTCRPALGVGGDYYDFLQLADGRFGFAIGDVSGKGVAAALLMASLQASLRGQTLEATDDLAAVMRRMNKLLFEATAPNRYATFFYAQYDPASRALAWVNAGHCAPLLFRGAEVRRLDEGGPVIGLLPDVEYEQGSARLECGDLVVAFTDGISEAMNSQDEEWGEERLRTAIAKLSRGLPVAALLDELLKCADAHASGARQHDDMTLVAIRVLAAS